MKILKFEKCYGLQITKRIELWIAMPHYTIPRHEHPDQDADIYHLFSDSVLHRVRDGVEKTISIRPFKSFLKHFNLLGSDIHWFTTGNWPLVFLNVKRHSSLTSPSQNLKLTTFN